MSDDWEITEAGWLGGVLHHPASFKTPGLWRDHRLTAVAAAADLLAVGTNQGLVFLRYQSTGNLQLVIKLDSRCLNLVMLKGLRTSVESASSALALESTTSVLTVESATIILVFSVNCDLQSKLLHKRTKTGAVSVVLCDEHCLLVADDKELSVVNLEEDTVTDSLTLNSPLVRLSYSDPKILVTTSTENLLFTIEGDLKLRLMEKITRPVAVVLPKDGRLFVEDSREVVKNLAAIVDLDEESHLNHLDKVGRVFELSGDRFVRLTEGRICITKKDVELLSLDVDYVDVAAADDVVYVLKKSQLLQLVCVGQLLINPGSVNNKLNRVCSETGSMSSTSLPYGPPSHTSTLETSFSGDKETSLPSPSAIFPQPRVSLSNLPTGPCQMHACQDGWVRFTMPFHCIDFVATDRHLYTIDQNSKLLFSLISDHLEFTSFENVFASRISAGEGFLWYISDNESLYSLPIGNNSEPLLFSENVLNFSVFNNTGIVVKENILEIHLDLDGSRPHQNRPIVIRPPFEPAAAEANSETICIMSVDRSLYFFPRRDLDNDSTSVAYSQINIPLRVTALRLGPGPSLFVVDVLNNVHFSTNWRKDNPTWFQLSVPSNSEEELLPPNQTFNMTTVASNNDSIWTCLGNSSVLLMKNTAVTGHTWSEICLELENGNCSINWIEAGNINAYLGSLVINCLNEDKSQQMYCYQATDKKCKKLQLPNQETSGQLTLQAPITYFLSTASNIYLNLSSKHLHNISHKNWMLFDKKSERPNVHLNHISSGLGVLFGLDTTSGLAYYRQCAEPKAICRRLESQERWRQLDTQHRLTWLAARDSVVWALDASGFVLVREGVYSECPEGTGWLVVPGVLGAQVCVSARSAWVLTAQGQLAHRVGITKTNWVGDYWMMISPPPPPNGKITSISSSSCDSLYCLDSSNRKIMRLWRHELQLCNQDSPQDQEWTLID